MQTVAVFMAAANTALKQIINNINFSEIKVSTVEHPATEMIELQILVADAEAEDRQKNGSNKHCRLRSFLNNLFRLFEPFNDKDQSGGEGYSVFVVIFFS